MTFMTFQKYWMKRQVNKEQHSTVHLYVTNFCLFSLILFNILIVPVILMSYSSCFPLSAHENYKTKQKRIDTKKCCNSVYFMCENVSTHLLCVSVISDFIFRKSCGHFLYEWPKIETICLNTHAHAIFIYTTK